MDDDLIFAQKQADDERAYESLCKRCGACCGSLGPDPCANLMQDPDGKYRCRDYDHRIGEQKTVSGVRFSCVPIRDVLTYAPPCQDCGYA